MITRCRICHGTTFQDVLDLGFTPMADGFLTAERLDEPETHYPLKVIQCRGCLLFQLSHVVSRTKLYADDYPYVSSTTRTGVEHYHAMAASLTARFGVVDGLAVDIGSNVGVLADGFKRVGMRALGVEPVAKIARLANLNGVETVNEFFGADLASSVVASRGSARIVTGTNVVAHIDDLHDLMRGVSVLLDEKGVFVFEAPYVKDLIENLAYDTVYHEHLSYLALRPIQALCERFGLTLFDVEKHTIHGGTLRYFIAQRGNYTVTSALERACSDEDAAKLGDASTLSRFADRVFAQREDLIDTLRNIRRSGDCVCAVSAPAKGMTLLNYCGIGRQLLDFVTEKAPLKIGLFTPGTHIPVVADEELIKWQPDYALLLAWNFATEIIENLHEFRGRFLIPIPQVTIARRTSETVV